MVLDTRLWLPLLVLFFGRGALMLFDRVEPFLRRQLRLTSRRREPLIAHGQGETLIFGLYIRIFVMQVTIILGAWLALLAGNAGALVFLIATKTAVDLTFQVVAERFHAAWVQANGLNPPTGK